ncbi:MAG: hypothetical protein LBD32_02400, partial [Cytophagales bacterium]|nr:hypothetical protein [Cytophagales bacterium]
MFKFLKRFCLLFFVLGCSVKNENLVEGGIKIKRILGLNPSTIEKFTNPLGKSLSLFGAQEVAELGGNHILKNANN